MEKIIPAGIIETRKLTVLRVMPLQMYKCRH